MNLMNNKIKMIKRYARKMIVKKMIILKKNQKKKKLMIILKNLNS